MAEPPASAPTPDEDGADKSHHGAFTRAAKTFIFVAAALYGLAALSMAVVISVAILDVAKYVMEEEVLRSRELRMPHEGARSRHQVHGHHRSGGVHRRHRAGFRAWQG